MEVVDGWAGLLSFSTVLSNGLLGLVNSFSAVRSTKITGDCKNKY